LGLQIIPILGMFVDMKLAKYLNDRDLSSRKFASEMGGVSASGVRKWIYGERIPRPDQMRKIAEITGGLVEPNDFILNVEDTQ
jgi:transcriptional regulator with XRE-family HTH domain